MNLSKAMPLLILAGVLGLAATVGVNRYVNVKTAAAFKPTRPVVVATNDIYPGTAITSASTRVVSWPKDLVPAKAADSFQAVQDRIVTVHIAKGEPILSTKLAPEGTSAGLGALLTGGKRAFTVRVDDVSGVAGFVHPGDHVDVLVELQVPDSSEHFSKTVLQNIVVLTAGQVWEKNKETKPGIVNTVTLELTLQEAEILNLVSTQGKIRLALRNRTNTELVQTQGVATSHIIGGDLVKKRKEDKTKNPENGRYLEVIKGMDRAKAHL